MTDIEKALNKFEAEQFLANPLVSHRDLVMLRLGFTYGDKWAQEEAVRDMEVMLERQ